MPNGDFEELVDWDLVAYPQWPATSLFHDDWGTAAGRGTNSDAVALSNHAYGFVTSDPVAATGNTSYELKVWLRGELDGEGSAGCWTLRLFYYGQGGSFLGQGVAASSCNPLSTLTWQQVGTSVTTHANTQTVKAVFYAFMNSGWVAVDDFSLKLNGQGANLLAQPGFEQSGGWTFEAKEEFPGTSIWRGTWGTADGRNGSNYAVAISNHAYGWLRSEELTVESQVTAYRLKAWLRGELDGDDSYGCWRLKLHFYDSQGSLGSEHVPGDCSAVTTDWQQKGGVIDDIPTGAETMRVEIVLFHQSGWLAFDDVTLEKQVSGQWSSVSLDDPGFEDDETWDLVVRSGFPGTSIWLGDWGTAWPRNGSQAAVISNHAYGEVRSPELDVDENTCYILGAWLRGEVDEEDAFAGWYMSLEFYEDAQSVRGETVVEGYWVNPTWTYVEGRAVAPAGAEKVRIKLYGQMTSGWVTYDDISLRECDGGGTQGTSGDTSLDASERDLARVGRVPSPEETLSRQQPRWRYEDLVECEDPEGCPEVAQQEPTKVQWAPVSNIDRAIGRSLMGDLVGKGGETQAAPESSGSVVVKRYVFGGQVVAMRHDGTLYFLRPDHLGSASLILDVTGRWVADHRFYPYGETRRSDGASESYPTDKLFTGMLLKERLGIYRMGARWYDASISRWLSADSLVPEPGNPQALNRLGYVEGNPLAFLDPTGHAKYGGDDYDEADEPLIPPLPSSFVIVVATYANGKVVETPGVAIDLNAVLSHNHYGPLGEIDSISILNASGEQLYAAGANDFVAAGDISLDAGFTLFTFEDDFMQSWETAQLGDAGTLDVGDTALQSVRVGAIPGLYETTVIATGVPARNLRYNRYTALVVSPDQTVPGDSGAPLYVNDHVYGVNSAGAGVYGSVTDVEKVLKHIAILTYTLGTTPNKP